MNDSPYPTTDPEILALLDFEPVPRKRIVEGSWTPELQREFIARLAVTGSIGRAAEEMGKTETGVRKLYRSPEGASFRAAWHAAIALAKRRKEKGAAREPVIPGSRPPSLDNRRKSPSPRPAPAGGEGEMLGEHGEPADEDSVRARAEDARDSISGKLQRSRRIYLQEISDSPGKRAAFEILTELPIDWEAAARLEPQVDEPWRKPNMREADMLLTAENGWLAGWAHGPDKVAELRAAIDKHREEDGLGPVEWQE
jgi:hypothetical protein